MLHFKIIFLLFFFGCSGTSKPIFNIFSGKSYSEYLLEYKSCTGKGILKSKGALNGRLLFTFKSQRDSTFIDFSDPIGRKTLLVWVTKNSITARNLIENRQYDNEAVRKLLPILKVLNPSDITKIVWGVKPEENSKINKSDLSYEDNFEMKFYRKNLGTEKRALASIYFDDFSFNTSIKMDFKTRNRNLDFVDMKKVWRLLKY